MYILLFRTALLECFIYSRVKILRCAKIPVASTKNKVIAISVHLIRKKIPSFQIIYYLSKKSCLSIWFTIFFWLIEEIPSLTAFAREWKSIGLQNTSRLFLVNISSKFCKCFLFRINWTYLSGTGESPTLIKMCSVKEV